MSKQDVVVEAHKRTEKGKNASRRLRHAGKVPAVLYGGDGAAMPLTLEPKHLEAILHSESGENTLFGLDIAGEGRLPGKVMIKEHQVDPLTSRLVHADLMRIAMDRAIRVQVAIHTVGTARGVKLQGGILDHPLREIEVECLPADIPERIDVDITELDMGKAIRVSDITPPAGVKFLTEATMAVVAVVAPTVEKVAVPGAEGAPAAEAPTEPEVIKKGKAETAEEGEAPEAKGGEKKGGDKGGKSEKK
ncbi:MAG TPA: 50S ribosomal protein L25 [Candidatus Polarisedimenticolia bacterium]|nr:50S ribosomal protein L25 [Candidatus Polarisedimenticolia bacterium]